MRKFVALLLLVVLPLISVYAAAGSYCAHETSTTGENHFGHHSGPQQGSQSSSDEAVGSLPDQSGYDCPVHNLAGIKLVTPSSLQLLAAPISNWIPPFPAIVQRSAELKAPEHRDKARLA